MCHFHVRSYRISRVSLSVQIVCLYVGGYLSLPSVSVVKQLLFVVQQLLMGLCGELKVWTLNNSINGAGFLTETTVDALGHIDVIACGPPAAIGSSLSFNSDSLSRADGLTKLTSNAAFLSIRVAAERVLPPKAG